MIFARYFIFCIIRFGILHYGNTAFDGKYTGMNITCMVVRGLIVAIMCFIAYILKSEGVLGLKSSE